VRLPLIRLLLEFGPIEEAVQVARMFGPSRSVQELIALALAEFLTQGDSPAARQPLTRALEANPRAVVAVARAEELGQFSDPPDWVGDPNDPLEEAVVCAKLLGGTIQAHPGAARWLDERLVSFHRRPEPRSTVRSGRPGFKQRPRRSR